MLSKVVVIPKEEFEKWLNDSSSAEVPNEGEELLGKHGCFDCHSTDGTELVGPSFKGLYGRETVVVENGKEKTIKADDAYIEKSILEPGADVVKGYEDMMPPFELSKEELGKMLEYFKGGGKPAAKPGAKGAEVAEREGCTGCHSIDGSELVGPSFKGLMDRKTIVTKDGKKMEVTANIEYIISSIKHPEEYIVEGFDPSMPAYDALSDDDIKALIEYISTLK
jgi:cytochrome c oxidase subunit 2